MDIKFIQKYEPSVVKMEVEFIVNDPAKLISAWAGRVEHAVDIITQESDQSINWAQCILDLMTEKFDEEKYGIEFHASACDKNPEPQYFREEYLEALDEAEKEEEAKALEMQEV
jgi:hypothetical protein